jgi:hypothetical protein
MQSEWEASPDIYRAFDSNTPDITPQMIQQYQEEVCGLSLVRKGESMYVYERVILIKAAIYNLFHSTIHIQITHKLPSASAMSCSDTLPAPEQWFQQFPCILCNDERPTIPGDWACRMEFHSEAYEGR